MKYAILIHDLPDTLERLSPAQREEVLGRYFTLSKDDRVVGGERLMPGPSARTVRSADDGVTVSDGPATDGAAQLSGYYLVEVIDEQEAITLASGIPAVELGGAVEVRALMER